MIVAVLVGLAVFALFAQTDARPCADANEMMVLAPQAPRCDGDPVLMTAHP